MPNRVRSVSFIAILMLVNVPLLCKAQTLEAALDGFLSQSFSAVTSRGAVHPELPAIEDWSARHPSETVEIPGEGQNAGPRSAQNSQDRKLEGHWCLRSTAVIDLADGVRVRRIALFYQPLVEEIYDSPLPPLPTESGAVLRQHGCRLVRILSEFELKAGIDPRDFVETIAKRLPGKPSEEPDTLIVNSSQKDFWQPIYSFDYSDFFYLFTHNSAGHPAVLLEWEAETLDYGEPSSKVINPEAGQPWLPLRAAMLARLPEAPTLNMLSFLVPQVGDEFEQPPFYCDRQLVPVLRSWLSLAARSAPQQHAAALLVADAVADQLSECTEFEEEPYNSAYADDDAWERAHDVLKKDLKKLGIETEHPARLGPEYYTGNLLAQIRKLAPSRAVNELSWIATLDRRCQWDPDSDPDCADFIQSGESFLSRFPADEWTPSIHLLLAEAYSITAADLGESDSDASDSEKIELQKKAAAHFRAWYVSSKNDRDRALVWEEIWGIEAGLGPWLMVPDQLRQ